MVKRPLIKVAADPQYLADSDLPRQRGTANLLLLVRTDIVSLHFD